MCSKQISAAFVSMLNIDFLAETASFATQEKKIDKQIISRIKIS